MTRKSIAVVGTGISGLSAAWLLSQRHSVTVYEKNARAGGHSNTVDVRAPEGDRAVDTGFIVYNVRSYPNLVALFDHLKVATAPTRMTFSVSLDRGSYEYSGSGLLGLMGQRRNIASPRHWRMIGDLLRFFRAAEALAEKHVDARLTLGEFLAREGFAPAFVFDHILPMGAAIWSMPPRQILGFPAISFARFFANHGLLQIRNRPAWRTVVGGSRAYVGKLLSATTGAVHLCRPAVRLIRQPDGVLLRDEAGRERRYDQVVLATHADQALDLLSDADPIERRALGAFGYASNRAVLHTDAGLMPRRRRLWSSWNYLGERGDGGRRLCTTYWMNSLQPLRTGKNYFVTLNPNRPIREHHIEQVFDYGHPIFDRAAIEAQPELWGLQGRRRTWFCGSYFGYGFHEDGLQAGLAVAERLSGVRRPWTVANESGRLQLPAEDVDLPLWEAAE